MSLPATIQPVTPVQSSQEKLMAFLQSKYPDYHPLVSMLEIARDQAMMGQDGDAALQFSCHKEIAKYVLKVDRHVEVKQEVQKTRRVLVELFGDGQQKDAPKLEPGPDGVLQAPEPSRRTVSLSTMEQVGQAIDRALAEDDDDDTLNLGVFA